MLNVGLWYTEVVKLPFSSTILTSRKEILLSFSCSINCEKPLPVKGLNFSIPCKKLDYADYVVQFELFEVFS